LTKERTQCVDVCKVCPSYRKQLFFAPGFPKVKIS